jgi:hypothetical protein
LYAFLAQRIAEVIPEAVGTHKETLYDVYNDFRCNNNILHVTILLIVLIYNPHDYSGVMIMYFRLLLQIIKVWGEASRASHRLAWPP